jgi:hypothetical protein
VRSEKWKRGNREGAEGAKVGGEERQGWGGGLMIEDW